MITCVQNRAKSVGVLPAESPTLLVFQTFPNNYTKIPGI